MESGGKIGRVFLSDNFKLKCHSKIAGTKEEMLEKYYAELTIRQDGDPVKLEADKGKCPMLQNACQRKRPAPKWGAVGDKDNNLFLSDELSGGTTGKDRTGERNLYKALDRGENNEKTGLFTGTKCSKPGKFSGTVQ